MREKRIQIKVTEQERQTIQRAAHRDINTMTGWARQVLLKAAHKEEAILTKAA